MIGAVLRFAGRAVPTVLVLGAMVGIGLWGHHSHWSLPSLSELRGSSPEPVAASSEGPAPAVAESGSRFSVVRFDSLSDVHGAGISTTVAKLATVDEWVPASAVVEYNSQRVAQLSCPVSGRVYSIRGLIGRAVRKGEVLVLVDAQEVGRAKSAYLQEHLLARYKADVLSHLRNAGSGVVPPRSMLDAESQAKEAELRRFTAKQRLLNLGFSIERMNIQAQTPQELAKAIQFLGLPAEVVAELKPRPTSANLFPLVAPFDGVVIRQDLVAGEVISPDRAQLEIADVDSMWIRLSVRMEDADWLDLGQEVEFTAPGLPEPVRGKLNWVSTEIEEKTRTIQARCSVENPVVSRAGRAPSGLRLLRANQFGAARVHVASHADSIVVPDEAIQRMPDRSVVLFVAQSDGTTFEARTVRLGLTRSGLTQILDGVAPKERVVTKGSYLLKSELMKESLVTD